MNLKPLGITRAIRGLREGNQPTLVTGLALIAIQYLRNSTNKKELVYRKKVPIGSMVVVRHARRGDPRVEIFKPPRDQTR